MPLMDVRSPMTGRRGVSLPFSDSVPLLSTPAHTVPHLIEDALDYERRRRKWRYVEIRSEPCLSGFGPSGRYFEHIVALDRGCDALYRNLRQSTRRNVERARREALATAVSCDAAAVEAYYRLHCRTRRRHGLPPQPLSFFRNLHASLIKQGHGIVVIASSGGTPVGGAVFLHFGDRAVYKYGASVLEERHLHPSNMVMWEAISWYSFHGYSSLSLGRTACHNAGLLQYKDGWGAERREIHYARSPARRNGFDESEGRNPRLAAIARRMPLLALRMVGRIAYRHLA